MSNNYDSWLNNSSAYEEWAGLLDEEDVENTNDDFDTWRELNHEEYDAMRGEV